MYESITGLFMRDGGSSCVGDLYIKFYDTMKSSVKGPITFRLLVLRDKGILFYEGVQRDPYTDFQGGRERALQALWRMFLESFHV